MNEDMANSTKWNFEIMVDGRVDYIISCVTGTSQNLALEILNEVILRMNVTIDSSIKCKFNERTWQYDKNVI